MQPDVGDREAVLRPRGRRPGAAQRAGAAAARPAHDARASGSARSASRCCSTSCCAGSTCCYDWFGDHARVHAAGHRRAHRLPARRLRRLQAARRARRWWWRSTILGLARTPNSPPSSGAMAQARAGLRRRRGPRAPRQLRRDRAGGAGGPRYGLYGLWHLNADGNRADRRGARRPSWRRPAARHADMRGALTDGPASAARLALVAGSVAVQPARARARRAAGARTAVRWSLAELRARRSRKDAADAKRADRYVDDPTLGYVARPGYARPGAASTTSGLSPSRRAPAARRWPQPPILAVGDSYTYGDEVEGRRDLARPSAAALSAGGCSTPA